MGAVTANRTPARGPSRRQQRSLQRAIHLITGVALVAQFYATSLPGSGFTTAVRWIAVPMVVTTGVAMWQGPRIRRWLHASGVRSA